jgi:uncharacterized protein YfeS
MDMMMAPLYAKAALSLKTSHPKLRCQTQTLRYLDKEQAERLTAHTRFDYLYKHG